jgi:hypothetical protein
MATVAPEDIFDEKELAEWALDNGFIREDDAPEYVKDHHHVGDVYDYLEIQAWALDEGFTRASEED